MKEFTVREARQRKAKQLKRPYTQDDLSKDSGLDQTTISDLETGRNTNPRLDTIRRLAEALGIRPVQLRFSSPKPKSIGTRGVDREGHSSHEVGR